MDTLKILRWTVVSRETDDAGRLARGATGYRRTTEPQEEREEEFVRFSSRLRVVVSWGGVPIVATAEFSLTSGRCIGHPDWILRKEQLRPLRKMARHEFPKEEKKDDEDEAAGRTTSAEKEETQREVVGATSPERDDGGESPLPQPTAPDRQRDLFPE